MKCERHHQPGCVVDSTPPEPSRADLRLIIACAAWQICDTHPPQNDLLRTVVGYTETVINDLRTRNLLLEDVEGYVRDALHAIGRSELTPRPHVTRKECSLASVDQLLTVLDVLRSELPSENER